MFILMPLKVGCFLMMISTISIKRYEKSKDLVAERGKKVIFFGYFN